MNAIIKARAVADYLKGLDPTITRELQNHFNSPLEFSERLGLKPDLVFDKDELVEPSSLDEKDVADLITENNLDLTTILVHLNQQ